MQYIITDRMCAFCDFIRDSKFLDWKLSAVDVVVIAMFIIFH